MAVISKIRNRSGLIIAVVGLAMLAFILGDFFNSSGRFFSGQENNVAVIGGKKISRRTFEKLVEYEGVKRFGGSGSINEAQKRNLRNVIWDNLIFDNVLVPQANALGMGVAVDELWAAVDSERPSQALRAAFSDRNGQINPDFLEPGTNKLDRAKVAATLRQLEENGQGAQFVTFEEMLQKELLENKYYDLIRKSIYVTTNEAKRDLIGRKRTATFSYVVQKYNTVDDSEVQYDESDLKKYWSANNYKAEFQQESETRSIEYVAFDALATQSDSTAIKEDLMKVADKFKSSKDDERFVSTYSDNPRPLSWYTQGDLTSLVPAGRDSLIVQTDSGAIYGPYVDAMNPQLPATFSIAKVVDVKMTPDTANARQIVIAFKPEDQDTVRAFGVADSVLKLLDGGADFAAMVEQFSDDPQSAAKDGEIGMKRENEMIPRELADKVFAGKVNDVVLVRSNVGYIIAEITEQSAPVRKVKVGFVNKEIVPLKETVAAAYKSASEFARNTQSTDAWQGAAQTHTIKSAPDLKPDQRDIFPLTDAREIVNWAFRDAEVGEIRKQPFRVGNTYVVPRLLEIKEKGILGLDVETVRQQVIAEVVKEKKAEKLAAQQAGYTDLDKLASDVGGIVEKVDKLNFASFSIPGIGNEPALMGVVFALEEGKIVAGFEGDLGVYTVRMDQINEVGETNPADIENERGIAENQRGSRVSIEVFNTLVEKADVEDNRALLY